MADNFNPGQESVAQTASPNIQTQQARFDPNGSVNSLLAALGSPNAQAQMDSFRTAFKERQTQEQSEQVESIKQQFKKDHVSGAVSAAQIGQMRPDLVPVIRARVAESLGKDQGALDAQAHITKIDQDDTLNSDTDARTAYIAKAKAEMFKSIPPGNDFYASGVMSAFNNSFAQNAGKWQTTTDNFYQKTQEDAFGKEIAQGLESTDPGQAMRDSFKRFDTSSLNPLNRNTITVATTIQAAIADAANGGLRGEGMLKSIPPEFLNTASKAKLAEAQVQLSSLQWTQHEHMVTFQTQQREQAVRDLNMSSLKAITSGQAPDWGKLVNNPQAFEFAKANLNNSLIPEVSSKSSAATFERRMYDATTVGNIGTPQQVQDKIQADPTMNPSEKVALIAKIPQMLEGHMIMNDERVHTSYSNRISPTLDALGKSSAQTIGVMQGLANLVGASHKMYESDIRNSFTAWLGTKGDWPRGDDAQKLIDVALERNEKFVQQAGSLDNLINQASGKSTPAATPSATPAKTATARPSASPTSPANAAIAAELALRKKS